MIYLFTAMYSEAHLLIRQYELKKETDQTHFQVFSNESRNMRLIITGTGMIAAAAAVSVVCTKYPPQDYDFLINIGICAGRSSQREPFLCNKITEQTTGKTFYPDMLYRHPFFEAQIITGAKPFQKEDLKQSREICLYDMEASAIYQSGSYFFGPHQMFFLKLISDSGNFEHVAPKQIQSQIAANSNKLAAFLEQLNQIHNTVAKITAKCQPCQSTMRSVYVDDITDTLCQDLHCSNVMEASLRQHIRYCILSGINYRKVIYDMYQEKKLPCRDKREGKLRFEELKKRLL